MNAFNISNPFYNKVRNIIAGMLLGLVAGCSLYTSEVPISNNNKSVIDEAALGLWGAFVNDTLVATINVNPLDSKSYVVSYAELDENGYDFQIFNTFVTHNSVVKNSNYINVKILEGEDIDKYYLFLYEIKGDSLKLKGLDDDFKLQFNSSKKLKKYIEKNQQKFNDYFSIELKFKRYSLSGP